MPLSCSEKELRLIRILLTIIAIPVVVLIFRTLKSIFIPWFLPSFSVLSLPPSRRGCAGKRYTSAW